MRLFVAIRPPRPVREQLLGLMTGVRGARWQDDDQLHLTLRFIGELDHNRAEDVVLMLESLRFPRFEIALEGSGVFERKGRQTALWAGIAASDSLISLQHKIENGLQRLGLEPEHRSYLPHITLARLNSTSGPTDGFLAEQAGLSSPPFPVDHFDLIESRLGRNGARYESLARYWLE